MSRRRRFSGTRRRSYPAWFVLLLAALILFRWWQTERQQTPESLAEQLYQVERVVDGDTLKLANKARVRLIGADTPETVKPNWPVEPFGPEATEFTRRFIDGANGVVRLRLDRERTDRYGRFLAYVYDGDRMLNEELIREGLARASLQYNYSASMKTRFRRAEDAAKAAGRGIWSLETSQGLAPPELVGSGAD